MFFHLITSPLNHLIYDLDTLLNNTSFLFVLQYNLYIFPFKNNTPSTLSTPKFRIFRREAGYIVAKTGKTLYNMLKEKETFCNKSVESIRETPMKKRMNISALLLALSLAVTSLFTSPACVYATETEKTPAQQEMDTYYAAAIESNETDNWPQGPAVYAKSAIVMDIDTGAILYSKNIDEQLYPASITKIMTTLLAIENCELDERVTFSDYAINSLEWNCSRIGIRVGEVISVEECLYGMMLESANEVCLGIAEHIDGDDAAFAERMNARAKELGCTNTNFVNPNGMPDEDHVTTAHDMALIAAAAYKNETFRQVCGTLSWQIGWTNKAGENRYLNQHHKMLKSNESVYYEYATGGKTGYTTAALNTLVTYASKDGRNLVCVVMRDNGQQYEDTKNLLNYGFDSFTNTSFNPGDYTADDLLFPAIFLHVQPDTVQSSEPLVTLPEGFTKEELSVEITQEENSLTYSYSYQEQFLGRMTQNLDCAVLELVSPDSDASQTVKNQQEALTHASPLSSASSGAISAVQNIMPEETASFIGGLENWQLGIIGVVLTAIVLYIIILITSIRRRIRKYKRRKARERSGKSSGKTKTKKRKK